MLVQSFMRLDEDSTEGLMLADAGDVAVLVDNAALAQDHRVYCVLVLYRVEYFEDRF
jgi:hypothetical protein